MDVWSFYSAHHFEDSLKGASQRFEAFERQMEDSNTSRAAAIKEARKIYTLNIQKLLRIHSFRVSFFCLSLNQWDFTFQRSKQTFKWQQAFN